MKKLLAVTMLLAGCATQSGVIPEGRDSYLVLISGGLATSGIELKIKAHKEANAYCAGQNKRVETISEKNTQAGLDSDHPAEELKFRCIANPDVPEAAAPAKEAH